MSNKYKPLTAPITRREACTIVDRRRFDGAVRTGILVTLGKDGEGVTSPLVFDQPSVREFAKRIAAELLTESRALRASAKEVEKMKPPLTRRQVARLLGKRLTGILIRSGELAPDGKLTDTQTAAHTYNPIDVAALIRALADEKEADSKLLARAAKTRVPA